MALNLNFQQCGTSQLVKFPIVGVYQQLYVGALISPVVICIKPQVQDYLFIVSLHFSVHLWSVYICWNCWTSKNGQPSENPSQQNIAATCDQISGVPAWCNGNLKEMNLKRVSLQLTFGRSGFDIEYRFIMIRMYWSHFCRIWTVHRNPWRRRWVQYLLISALCVACSLDGQSFRCRHHNSLQFHNHPLECDPNKYVVTCCIWSARLLV